MYIYKVLQTPERKVKICLYKVTKQTFATMADQTDGSARAALARTQMYGLQKHFILNVEAARRPRGTDWPAVIFITSQETILQN